MSGLLSNRGAGRRSGLSRLGRAGVAVLLAVSLSGCWTQIGHNTGNTRYNDLERRLTTRNVESLFEEWSVLIGQTARSSTSVVSEPIVSGNKLYVTVVESLGESVERLLVQSYDTRSGDLVWERALLPDDVADGTQTVVGDAQPVTLYDGELWVPYWYEGLPDCGGKLARLDPATGEVLASEDTGRIRTPVVAGIAGREADYPIVTYTEFPGCDEDSIHLKIRGFSSGVGHTAVLSQITDFDVDSTPTIVDGVVYIAPGDGFLWGWDVDPCDSSTNECDYIWDIHPGGYRDRPVAGPDGTVLVRHEETTGEGVRQSIHAFGTASRDLEWQTEPAYLGGPAGIAVAGDTVYVAGSRGSGPIDPDEPPTGGGDAAGLVEAYQPASCSQPACEPSWTLGLGPNMPTTAPTVAGGVVYVGVDAPADDPPAVVGVDARGCGERWCPELVRVPLVDEVSSLFDRLSQLSVAQGRVFVAWHSDYAVPPGRLTALAPTKRK